MKSRKAQRVGSTLAINREDEPVGIPTTKPSPEQLHDLLKGIVHELYKTDMVIIHRTTDIAEMTDYFRAVVNVLPPEIQYVCENDNYKMQGNEFTEDQIQQALLEAFPEKFI